MITPLVWGTVLFAIGILLGDAFSGVFYLFTSVGMLGLTALWWKRRTTSNVLMLATWVCLGAARANVSLPNVEAWWEGVQRKASTMNERMVERLQSAELSDEAMELCTSVTLGNKSRLTRQTRQAFSQTGASHLLALSGMHLGIFYAILHVLFLKRIPLEKRRWWGPPIVLTICWTYAFVAGLPPSLVRATIMLSCCVLFFRVNDPHLTLHRLSLCALLMWLLSPSYIYQLSFWLSFLAIFFIMEFYQPLGQLLKENYEFQPNAMERMFGLSVVAQIGTLPLSLYYFHTLPFLGALWSVLLIPLTGLVMYLTLLTLVLPFGFIGTVLNGLVDFLRHTLSWMGNTPCTVLHNVHPTTLQVILLYALLLCLTLRLRIYIARQWYNR